MGQKMPQDMEVSYCPHCGEDICRCEDTRQPTSDPTFFPINEEYYEPLKREAGPMNRDREEDGSGSNTSSQHSKRKPNKQETRYNK